MRARLVPAVLTTLLLVVAACSDGGDEDIGADGGSDDGGETSGEQLVAAISGRPDQLDPHVTTAYASFQVLENVYDTLVVPNPDDLTRSEEHTSELQSLMRTSYAVFCLKKKK